MLDLARMKPWLFTVPLAFWGALTGAQAPSPQAPAAQVHTSGIGFSYSIPSDWEVMDSQSSLPALQQQTANDARSEDEKKGLACTKIELTARHGDPSSVIVVVALPYDCFGQAFSDKDLPGFGTGAAEGVKQSLDVSEPVYGSYALGTHNMWIERAQGSPKARPDLHYTVEVACSLLKKAAVCWMALAADQASLQVFERAAVSLDGETAGALVPANAFEKKPS
jgi:hypothetical protein